jgi:bis(5'-adenosyl)-triphosphatase
MVERVFDATALNVAIQDGVDAGQSVPHVHAHIIPRKRDDLADKGGTDAIYGMMEGEEGNVGGHLREREGENKDTRQRTHFPAEEERKPRTEEVMMNEAEWLASEMAKDGSEA